MNTQWYIDRLEDHPDLKEKYIASGYVGLNKDLLTDDEKLALELMNFDYYYPYSDCLRTWRSAKEYEERLFERISELPKGHPFKDILGPTLSETHCVKLIGENYPHIHEAVTNKEWRKKTYLDLLGLDEHTVKWVIDILTPIYTRLTTMNNREALARHLMYENRLSLTADDIGRSIGPTAQQAREISKAAESIDKNIVFYRGCLLPIEVKHILIGLTLMYPMLHRHLSAYHDNVPALINVIMQQLEKPLNFVLELTDDPEYGQGWLDEHGLVSYRIPYTHLLTVKSTSGYSWKLNTFVYV